MRFSNSNKSLLTSQTRGRDIFLKNIYKKRRGYNKFKFFLRKFSSFGKYIVIFALVISVLFVGYRAFNTYACLTISEVEIEGALNFVSYNDLKNLAENNALGNKICTFNEDALEKNIKGNFLGAKFVTVKKNYPKSLLILIEERMPLAILYNDNQSEKFLIDEEGYVLGFVGDKLVDLPEISYEEDIFIGKFVSSEIVPVSVDIINYSKAENLKIDSMVFYPKYTRIYVSDGVEVFIGNDKNKETAIKAIKALIRDSETNKEKLLKIDLRFDKVIVEYE